MLGDPRQVGLDRQPGAERIEIATRALLSFSPETPALPGADPLFLTQGIDVSEVPGRTTLYESHHFARDQDLVPQAGGRQCAEDCLGVWG